MWRDRRWGRETRKRLSSAAWRVTREEGVGEVESAATSEDVEAENSMAKRRTEGGRKSASTVKGAGKSRPGESERRLSDRRLVRGARSCRRASRRCSGVQDWLAGVRARARVRMEGARAGELARRAPRESSRVSVVTERWRRKTWGR